MSRTNFNGPKDVRAIEVRLYIQSLAGRMGKTTEDIKISLNISLKGSPSGVFLKKNFEIKIFVLKFTKNTTCYPKIKNGHFRVKKDVWASNCEHTREKALFVIMKRTFLLEAPSTDHSLSMGKFRGIFSLSKGWPLFLVISVCLLLEKRLSLHDFVVTVLFSLNKGIFRYCEISSFWGKKSFFGNSRFS